VDYYALIFEKCLKPRRSNAKTGRSGEQSENGARIGHNHARRAVPGGYLLRPSLSITGRPAPVAGHPAEPCGKGAVMSDLKKTRAYQELRASMLKDLKHRGLDAKAYTDKVDEYMDFWARRRELRDDVAARGLTVQDERGRLTENRSVSLEVQVSRQMLAIFTALGFDPKSLRGPVEDDDEL